MIGMRLRLALVCWAWVLLALRGEPAGVLVPRDGSAPIAVSSHRVVATLVDGLARTQVRQTFVNPHGQALEAVYQFPIPDGAALVGLALETGGQRLEGLLAERRTARSAYDAIVRRERDPALVEQIGRSTFRLSVFPVLPDQPTVVELVWIESVPLVHGEYRYVYPLAGDGLHTVTQQDLTLSLSVRSSVPIGAITSPLADLATHVLNPAEARASLERSGAALDQDIVVVTHVAAQQPSLAVRTYRAAQGDAWFAAIVTPPPLAEHQLLPRDITLVIDVSGSMGGAKLEQAKGAALWLLQNLRATDRVNLILFNDVLHRFADAPVPADAQHLADLARFVAAATAGGGTALGDVIREVATTVKGAGRVNTIVLLTDGLPTVGVQDREQIVGFARGAAARGLRLFPFGVGHDVDAALLEGVGAAGAGTTEVFRPDGEIESRLRGFLTRTASPAIADLALTLDGQRIEDVLPRPLPDVYLGEQAVIVGRVAAAGRHRVEVRGVFEGLDISLASDVDFGGAGTIAGDPTARDLYARARLAFLDQALRLRAGLSDQAYFAALDRGAYSTTDELVQAEIDLSLETGVQCAYTSFLALLAEDIAGLDPRNAEAIAAAALRAENRRRDLGGLQPLAQPVPTEVMRDLDDFDSDHELLVDERIVSEEEASQPMSNAPFGGKYGGRGGGKASRKSVAWHVQWPKRHQSPTGAWSADHFEQLCETDACGGAGAAGRDIGVTGLMLVAIMGGGNTVNSGAYKPQVLKGLRFLMNAQDDTQGCFGRPDEQPAFLLDHTFATLALTEGYGPSRWPMLKDPAQRAVDFLMAARTADGVWSRSWPDDGVADVLVTGFAVAALCSAQEFGLTVDPAALTAARQYFASITDPVTGEAIVDAAARGELNDTLPVVTAITLLSRILLGEDPASAVLVKQADLLLQHPPALGADGTADITYWLFGSYALFQMGGERWDAWQAKLADTVIKTQRSDGDARGSWDPQVDPRMHSGGRVYTSALMALILEAYYRYDRIVLAR